MAIPFCRKWSIQPTHQEWESQPRTQVKNVKGEQDKKTKNVQEALIDYALRIQQKDIRKKGNFLKVQ